MNTKNKHNESKAKDSGIERVESANIPPIKLAEIKAIENLRSLPREVSSDTILPNIADFGFTDGRAVGPLMMRLVRLGAITRTDGFRKSVRSGSHQTPRAVYLNLCS